MQHTQVPSGARPICQPRPSVGLGPAVERRIWSASLDTATWSVGRPLDHRTGALHDTVLPGPADAVSPPGTPVNTSGECPF
jgi:hypothetical protein